MSFEKSSKLTAAKLIAKFGIEATYTQVAGDASQVYNENTGLFDSVIAETPYAVKISPPRSAQVEDLADGQLLPDTQKFYIGGKGLAFEPKANDKVAFYDRVFRVYAVKKSSYRAYFEVFVV